MATKFGHARTPSSSSSCTDIDLNNLIRRIIAPYSTPSVIDSVDISFKNLTAKEVRVLGRGLEYVPGLKTVKLGSNRIGNEGAVVVSSYLMSNSSIVCLDLGFNEIGDEGVSALAEALRVNRTLETLYLSGNRISGHGFGYLEKSLLNNNNLRVLYISDNNADVTGARHMAEMLKTNSGLETLHLGGNKFGSEGVKIFSSGLRESYCTNLMQLNLNDSAIDDLGVVALAECLTSYRRLIVLNLSFNKITHVGAFKLANALRGYNSLETLLLDNNQIQEMGVKQLCGCFPTMSNLVHLNLGFNGISSEGLQEVLISLSEPYRIRILALSGNTMSSELSLDLAVRLSRDGVLAELYLDHMDWGHALERNIASGIVENHRLNLQKLTGFSLGAIIARLKNNESLSDQSNEQVLKYLRELTCEGYKSMIPGPIDSNITKARATSVIPIGESSVVVADAGNMTISEARPILLTVPESTTEGSYNDEVLTEEIVSVTNVRACPSFPLSVEDVAILLSDSNESCKDSGRDQVQYDSSSSALNSALLASMTGNEMYAGLIRSLREIALIPYDYEELLRLETYYLCAPKVSDSLDCRSNDGALSTPRICRAKKERQEWGSRGRRVTRKRGKAEGDVDYGSALREGTISSNGDSSCDGTCCDGVSVYFSAAKRAMNSISVPRISQYPRVRVII